MHYRMYTNVTLSIEADVKLFNDYRRCLILATRGSVRFTSLLQIILSVISVTPDMEKVLAFYEAKGFLEVRRITLPGDFPTDPLLVNDILRFVEVSFF